MIENGVVVDASVAVKWVLQESDSDQARSLAHAKLDASDLLPVECANILWRKVRTGDLSRREAIERFENLQRAPVTLTSSRKLLASALALALELRHPVYDCVYLALATERDVPLVTADEKLAKAARSGRKASNRVVLLSEIDLDA